MTKVSIIIINYKVADLVERCLASVYEHTQGVSFEIYLIDNASGDDMVSRISTKFPQVNIIANNQNLGFAVACNQGIQLSRGEYVLLLNPDTELKDDAISQVVSKMHGEPKVGIAGIHLVNPDGSHQSSGVRRFPKPLDQLLIMLKVPHLFRPKSVANYLMSDFDYRDTADVDQVMGAFFCIRRQLINQIGPLDQGFFIWFEEVDFCRRAKNAGWRVRYYHNVEAIHHRGTSFGQVSTFRKQAWIRHSLRRYMKKHYGIAAWLLFVILEPLFILLAAVAQIVKSK
ncbi:MAG: glycosyltransferase family 2 protein [Candidatus Uhrbacteria bacterium]